MTLYHACVLKQEPSAAEEPRTAAQAIVEEIAAAK